MKKFTPPRNRDAWGVIRGYVYQVELTIDRWLNLEKDQELELECGEDIDRITKSFDKDDDEQCRILEQVKRRDDSITLRKTSAIIAIACAVEHIENNPGLNLVFQYTTNARIGIERPSPFPKRKAAITVWEHIRKNNRQLDSREQTENIARIYSILGGVPKPSQLCDRTWQLFQNFITK